MSLWTDMLGSEIRFVQTASFGKLRIAEAGLEHPETLYLLHGIGGHLEAYAKNIVPLAEHFHVVAFDHLGHGLSEKRDAEYTPVLLAEVLAELMDAMGVECAHLSGESLGGWTAGFFAVRHPDRVLRLMLNTAGGLPILSEKGRADLEALKQLSARSSEVPPTRETVRKRMEWLFHPTNHEMITDELVETRLAFYSLPGWRAIAPRVLRMIAIHDDYLIPMEAIRAETLFLWTEDNPVHDVETARVCSGRVPAAQLYVMKSPTAHWPQYEAPTEFNEVSWRFLSEGRVAGSAEGVAR